MLQSESRVQERRLKTWKRRQGPIVKFGNWKGTEGDDPELLDRQLRTIEVQWPVAGERGRVAIEIIAPCPDEEPYLISYEEDFNGSSLCDSVDVRDLERLAQCILLAITSAKKAGLIPVTAKSLKRTAA